MLSLIFLTIFVLVIDFIWLNMNTQMYKKLVLSVQKQEMKVNIIGAFLSYFCVILLLVFYAIPLVRSKSKTPSIQTCIIYGGGMGFLAYAIFNFTNLGIFRNYDIKTALLDTIWGGVLFSISTIFYFYVLQKK